MKSLKLEIGKKARGKLSGKLGMTMVELLAVVAIIVILSGVSFIAVQRYQRGMGQIERDAIAKQIFVAAQNHLTMARGEYYLGVKNFGMEDSTGEGRVCYFVVDHGVTPASATDIYDQMLPFGSIDEVVRSGGSYIIRYQPESSLVLDVFYCSTTASPGVFNHDLSLGDYDTVKGLMGAEKKTARRNVSGWDGAILGWYGGQPAAGLATVSIEAPTIKVVNGDILYVNVTDPNVGLKDSENHPVATTVRLLIKGLTSKVEHYVTVNTTSNPTVRVVLDDITQQNGHFGLRRFDDIQIGDNGFIPGENIEVQAVSFSTGHLANVAYSNKVTTNSLFDSIADISSTDNVLETAYISSIRHLENLDKAVSNLGSRTETITTNPVDYEQFSIQAAVQIADLIWSDADSETNDFVSMIKQLNSLTDSPSIFKYDRNSTGAGLYYPVSPSYNLTYDGNHHSISNIAVGTNTDSFHGNAGLFGYSFSKLTLIQNLELKDFSIHGNSKAGALAGYLERCEVTNVLARNTTSSQTATISGTENAGGLIGVASNSDIIKSTAALCVEGGTTAGGLIGTASDGTITGCYSGGHTDQGEYYTHKADGSRDTALYNIKGKTVGGLVGSSSASISNSYSTCSVSGTDNEAGFVGEVTGGSISNCYATGLVNPTQASAKKYAFVADGTASLASFSGNYYYSTINVVETTDNNGQKTYSTMLPAKNVSTQTDLGKIQPIDLNTDTHSAFVGEGDVWDISAAYDDALLQYYGGKYPLRTIPQLPASGTKKVSTSTDLVAVHYGDWPAPGVFFVNNK